MDTSHVISIWGLCLVAAIEASVGLHLELGQDDTSSILADQCMNFSKEIGFEANGKVLYARAKAVKGLIELVNGNLVSADLAFQEFKENRGNSHVLSYGEFLHAKQDFVGARELYHKVIQEISTKNDAGYPYTTTACNMVPKEVLLAAHCALGQLEGHIGNFDDAEGMLTKALTEAEEHFGLRNPRVGVILVAMSLMYKHQAMLDHSSSLLIQEGLYRRAIDLLKAPPLVPESPQLHRRDIVALARGGYGEILCVQENRKSEGERMKKWAECVWGNRRFSLAEALEFSNPVVLDTRITRAL